MPNNKTEHQRRNQALAFHAHLSRPGPRHRNHAQQMQPHGEENECDEIISVTPHIAHHSPRRRRDRADGRDGDENTHGEQRRSPERAPHRHLSLFTD